MLRPQALHSLPPPRFQLERDCAKLPVPFAVAIYIWTGKVGRFRAVDEQNMPFANEIEDALATAAQLGVCRCTSGPPVKEPHRRDDVQRAEGTLLPVKGTAHEETQGIVAYAPSPGRVPLHEGQGLEEGLDVGDAKHLFQSQLLTGGRAQGCADRGVVLLRCKPQEHDRSAPEVRSESLVHPLLESHEALRAALHEISSCAKPQAFPGGREGAVYAVHMPVQFRQANLPQRDKPGGGHCVADEGLGDRSVRSRGQA
eukprot:scaffold1778_cov246-Pinguiococcus_pyrenoidosus.AAC.8